MPLITFLESDRFDRVTVNCEGQVYNFDDRTDSWSIWSISNLLGLATSSVNPKQLPYANDIRKLLKNSVMFQKRNIMEINPLLYKYGRSYFHFHVTVQIESTGVPGSSLYWSFIVKEGSSGTVLLKRTIKFVIVDKLSRTPKKIDEWFRNKYGVQDKLHDLPKKMDIKFDLQKLPKRSHQWKTRVRYSDEDDNMHTNQSVYTKLCLDGATSAAKSGHLKHYNEDICLYPVEFLDITFISQSSVNDELIVNVHQDENDISILHFLITKDDKPTTYTHIKFSLTKTIPRKYANM